MTPYELSIQLKKYYNEYYILQHLDPVGNQELNELVKYNSNKLIIPNIEEIVDMLNDFIRSHFLKFDKDLTIFDWVNYVFNSNIYEENLEKDNLLPYYIIKVEFVKLNILKELVDSIQDNYLNIIINMKIIECETNITNYYENLINSHNNFTKTIQLVNEMFTHVEKV